MNKNLMTLLINPFPMTQLWKLRPSANAFSYIRYPLNLSCALLLPLIGFCWAPRWCLLYLLSALWNGIVGYDSFFIATIQNHLYYNPLKAITACFNSMAAQSLADCPSFHYMNLLLGFLIACLWIWFEFSIRNWLIDGGIKRYWNRFVVPYGVWSRYEKE